MSNAAIFLGWNRPFHGKEGTAMDLMGRLNKYLEKLKNSGEITGYTRVWLEPHGGDLNGFVLIEGEVSKLQALKQTDEWNDGVIRLGLAVDGLGINHAVVRSAVDTEEARVRKVLKE
jgi:hypothetical protein